MAKLTYNVRAYNQETLPFAPETLEIFIGAQTTVDGVKFVNIETFLYQQLSPQRRLIINGKFQLPLAALEPMIERIELGGELVIREEVLNQYLRSNHAIELNT